MARIEEKLFINGEDKTGPAVRSAIKGQKSLGKSTKATSATMAESALRFRTAILQVAAAVGVYKAIGFSGELLSAADNIGKVADKVGLTTDELQELRFAAEQMNVPVTALDMGMQRFSRRLGEAAQGMGELMGIADQYNIQLRDNNGQMRSNIDVLEDFADVIQNAESDQERLRIAFKLFDSEGAALVNVMRNGSEGLDIMRMRAQALGIVVEEDLIRNAGLAQDELKILSTVIKAQLTTAVAGLAPEIASASSAMTDFVLNWVEGVKVMKDFFTVSKSEEIQRLEGRLGLFTDAVVRNKQILAGEGSFFESLRLTGVVKRDLREAETEVIRITDKLNKLRAEQQQDTPARARVEEVDQGVLELARIRAQSIVGIEKAAIQEIFTARQLARDEELARQAEFEQLTASIQKAGIQEVFEARQATRDIEMEMEQERLDSIAALNQEELSQKQLLEQQKMAIAQRTVGNAAALINVMAQKNKAAALVALALTKGLAISQTLAFGAAAELRAMMELPFPANEAQAAKIALWTKVNVGLIAALGVAQAAAIGSGGGPGGGGGAGGGGGGGGGRRGAPGPGQGPQQQAITIRLISDVQRSDDFVQKITTEIVQDATDQRNQIMLTTTEN